MVAAVTAVVVSASRVEAGVEYQFQSVRGGPEACERFLKGWTVQMRGKEAVEMVIQQVGMVKRLAVQMQGKETAEVVIEQVGIVALAATLVAT